MTSLYEELVTNSNLVDLLSTSRNMKELSL
jgi:hypothetical protein